MTAPSLVSREQSTPRRGQRAKPMTNTVDAYIAKQTAGTQAVLTRVRRLIRKRLPGAEETISYQIPAYRLDGQAVVYFAGWKQHWSLYPVTEEVRAALGSTLAPYKVSKGTLRFPLADPVPTKLVERIVAELARTAERRLQAKKAAEPQTRGRTRRS